MKTKTFIEKVESNLFTVKESHDGTIIFIYPSRSDFNIMAWVNKYENESHIYSVLPKNLAESLFAYTMTPIEEREEEKKYRYKFPFRLAVTEIEKDAHLRKEELRKDLSFIVVDTSGVDFAKNHSDFHFTDKEVEQYTGKARLLFDACEKIEVTDDATERL